MTGTEVTILLVSAALCSRATARPSAAFSWSWLGFTHFTGVVGFAAGALVAAFYF